MMATGDKVEITCYCSCGDALKGEVEETDIAYETHVWNAAGHLQDGHTVWVRGNPVNMNTVRASQGLPTDKRMSANYVDPR